MPASVSSHLAACKSLAERFATITGGHGTAEVEPTAEGGVTLRFSQGCPHAHEPHFEVVKEDQMSLLRALDALAIHVARALDANSEGLELAGIDISQTGVDSGFANMHLYCPAWHQAHPLLCSFEATRVRNGGVHVTLELVRPAELSEVEMTGWDRTYEAGLVGHLERLLPIAAEAVAQLLVLNASLGTTAKSVLLPGEHRQYTPFRDEGVVLREFDDGTPFWSVVPQGHVLFVRTEEGTLELPVSHLRSLVSALARWQAMCDAVREGIGGEPD